MASEISPWSLLRAAVWGVVGEGGGADGAGGTGEGFVSVIVLSYYDEVGGGGGVEVGGRGEGGGRGGWRYRGVRIGGGN